MFPPSCPGLQVLIVTPGSLLCVGAEDPNSGPCTSTASSLPREPSPQPHVFVLECESDRDRLGCRKTVFHLSLFMPSANASQDPKGLGKVGNVVDLP